MKGLHRIGNFFTVNSLLSETLSALRAGDYDTVRYLVKTTNVEVSEGTVSVYSVSTGPPRLRVVAQRARRNLSSTNLFFVACKIGFECFWLKPGLIEAVIEMIETGRLKNGIPMAQATGAMDVVQFNLAWHCIPLACNRVLRVMHVYGLVPLFAPPLFYANAGVLQALHIQLAQTVVAVRVSTWVCCGCIV
jgi:hypothetical protein